MEDNCKYRCKKCNWSGTEDQLVKDSVETCFGNDVIETCPSCGDLQVVEIKEETTIDRDLKNHFE